MCISSLHYIFYRDNEEEGGTVENTEKGDKGEKGEKGDKAENDKNDKKETFKRPVWMKQPRRQAGKKGKKHAPAKQAPKPAANANSTPPPPANDIKKTKEPKKKDYEGVFLFIGVLCHEFVITHYVILLNNSVKVYIFYKCIRLVLKKSNKLVYYSEINDYNIRYR